ncbi:MULTISPECIES: MSC_0882 family membrane protein [unclassified Mycoplasma]|uniref:MSC_0882 family membrane protein n=1 Tax=unclassified Mycoplasma TaxID=2683645 RepID=UPI002B25D2CB|nr:hypothetical protein [Mycoplasma sp. 1232]MEA4333938.1 hypothetical protein [Mycoplasma sp. 1232]
MNNQEQQNQNPVSVQNSSGSTGVYANQTQVQNVATNEVTNVNPKSIVPENILKLFKREKKLALLSFSIWFSIFCLCIVATIINYFVNTFNSKPPHTQGIAWYIGISIIFLISLSLWIKALTRRKSWVKTEEITKNSYINGTQMNGVLIAEAYRAITLKMLRLSWIYAFFLTYIGLFIAVVCLLYFTSPWEVNMGQEGSWIYINSKVEWTDILDNAFGSTKNMLIILGTTIAATAIVFTILRIYDRKRQAEIKLAILNNPEEVVAKTNTDRRLENKAWIKAYIIVFILVVLLPLTVFLYLIWKGVIKRGKK